MNQARHLEQLVARMTPEQLAVVTSFAENLLGYQTEHPEADLADSLLDESALLDTIQHCFPESKRQRLIELTRRSELEIITDVERIEYGQLAEASEAATTERIDALIKLAALRGVSLEQVMKDLRIGREFLND